MCAVICRKATVALPGANPSLPEHKIGIFVRFWPSEPPFSGVSSTKSGFLCAFASKFLPDGTSASNKPHLAEKSTPVWLAIWHTWAGFANSQLRCATCISLYLYICAYPRYCHLGAAAQTLANLSAHLHRLPTPPPYLRQMRLSPGRGRGCWMANAAAGCRWRSSCKSPRARILVLGTSGAHWPARWPRFELTERVDKS